MPNNPAMKLLVGIDEQASAKLMAGELTKIAKQIKDLKIKFKADPTAIKKLDQIVDDLAKRMPTEGIELLNTDTLAKYGPQMDDILTSFGDLGAHIHKVSSDANGDLSGMSVHVDDFQGNIEKINFNMIDGELQKVSSSTYTNFKKMSKDIETEINVIEKELNKLIKAKAQGLGTTMDDERIVTLLAQAEQGYGALGAAIEANNVMSDTKKNIEIANIQNMEKAAQATRDASEAEGARTKALKDADEVLKNYGQSMKELSKLEVARDTSGRADEIREEMAAMKEQVAGFEHHTNEIQKLDAAQEKALKVDKISTWGTAYEKTIGQIEQDMVKLATAYERLDHATARGETGKMEVQIEAIAKLEKKIGDAATEANLLKEGLTGLGAGADLKEFDADVKTLGDNMKKSSTATELFESKIGKVLETTRSGAATGGIFKDFLGGDRTYEDMEKLGKAIYGVDVELVKVGKDSSQFKQATDQMTYSVKDADGVWRKYMLTVDDTNNTIRKTSVTIDNTKKNVGSLKNQLQEATKKIATWGIATKAVYGTWRAFKDGISTVKELDTQLTQIAIVQGKGRESTKALGDEYARTAVKMAQTVSDVAQLNTELVRQGLSLEESAERADSIMKLSSAGMVSMEQSLQVITTGVNAMGVAHEQVADVILKASMLSASNVEGLGEAFSKTASGAKAAGMSIEETTAMIATMKEVTQEGDSQLGTSLKSMLARFNKVNEETGELNENLNDVQAAIESVGVEFADAEGQIRPFYDIMEDLSLVWDDLDKNTQAYVATQAAGVRQQNRFYAVVDNFNKVQAINNDLAFSAGTLQRSYATYLDSTEASSKKLKATLDILWINFINSDVLKFLTDTATGFLKLADSIGLLPIALSLLTAKAVISSKAMRRLRDDIAGATFMNAVKGSIGVVGSFQTALTQGFAAAGAGAKALALEMTAMFPAIAILGFLAFAVGKLTQAWKKNKEAQLAAKQELVDYQNETVDMLQSQHTTAATLDDIGGRYLELQKIVKQNGGTHALTAEEMEEYYSVQVQIKEILPDLASHEDSYGRVILDNVSSVEQLDKAHKDLLDTRLEDLAATSPRRQRDLIEQYEADLKEMTNIYKSQNRARNNIRLEFDEKEQVYRARNNRKLNDADMEIMKQANAAMEREQKEAAGLRAMHTKDMVEESKIFILNEYGEMSEGLQRIFSDVNIMEGVLDAESAEAFAQEIYDVYQKGFEDLDIEGLTGRFEDIFVDVQQLGQDHAEGIIDTETYKEKMLEIVEGLETLAENSTGKVSEIAKSIIESLSGMASEAVDIVEESSADILARQSENLEEISQQYQEAGARAAEYADFMDLLNDSTTTQVELTDAIMKDFPQWAAHMEDKAMLSQLAAEAMEMEDDVRAQTYISMLLNTESFVNESGGAYQQLMTALGKYYKGDITNYAELEGTKGQITEGLINDLNKSWGQYFKMVDGYIVGNRNAYAQSISHIKDIDAGMYYQLIDAFDSDMRKAQGTVRDITASIEGFKASINVPDFKNFSSNLSNIGKSGNKAGAGSKKAAGGAKKAGDAAKKAADDLKKLNDEIKEYNEQMKAIQDATKSVFDFAVKYINYVKDTHMKANDEVLEKAKKDAEDAYKDAIDIIDLRVEAELNVLQIKEDALAAEKEINEFIKKRSELQGDLVDLEYKAAIASLDTSAAGAKKRKTLEEQLADKRKSLEDLIREREERLQTEAFARQRQFVQDAADWERSQHEITKTTIIANAETIHADRLAKLEAEYTQENIYLKGKQATQTGMIENLEGDMIPLVAAFEELAKHNGEFWTFFGQEDVKAFGDTVEGVLKHVKKLGFETIQQWKAVKAAIDDSIAAAAKASSSSGGGGGGGGSSKPAAKAPAAPKGPQKNSLVQQVQGLLNSYLPRVGSNRRIAVDGYFGPATKSAALTVANSERTTKAMGDILRSFASTQKITQSQINTLKQQKITVPYSSGTSNKQKSTSGSSTTQSRNINMAYDKGGKIEHTGPAEVHGSKRAPEYVFNYPQFKDLARMIAREQFTAPKPKIAMAGGPSLSIDNFIRVDGNINKDTMPEFKRASENAITQLANKLKGWGN